MLTHEALTERVIGLAILVHKELGPGLLESVYETCLAFELERAGIAFKRQVAMPIVYHGLRLHSGFRADLLITDDLIVEIKAVDRLAPAHEAQLLTYLRMSQCEVGLLLNFNAVRLKDGLRRLVRSRSVDSQDMDQAAKLLT
jgi:GxxExxY protein